MTARTSGRNRDRRVALAIVTSAFSAMLLAANLATPLYAVWARRFGFSTAVLALIFAVYALVLIPALLVFGQLVVTGVGALTIATWHLRNRGNTPGRTAPDQGRTGQPVRSSR